MSGRKASIVARIHGLKHIQCLCAANLAHNDAVGRIRELERIEALDVDFFLLSPEDAVALRVSKAHDIGDLRNL